jgi:hypothetical protein
MKSLSWSLLTLLACMPVPAGLGAQAPTDQVDVLVQLAYEALRDELPEGAYGVVEKPGIALAREAAAAREALRPDPDRGFLDNRRFATRMGLRSGPLDELMRCPDRPSASGRPSCELADNLVALVAFTVQSAGEDTAEILWEVWRVDDDGLVPHLGGYKGFWISLARDDLGWGVKDVSIVIDS